MASQRDSSRKRSPLVGKAWHASSPLPVNTAIPSSKGNSPSRIDSFIHADDSSWSGDWKQLFADSASSDWPSQSAASSTSWSDELGHESTKRLSEQYEQLESTLYEDSPAELPENSSLAIECKQWKENFPHLRILGHGINGNQFIETIGNKEIELSEEEEVIASHGESDYIQQEKQYNNSIQTYSREKVTKEDIERYKDKVRKAVMDKIFSKIWPDVIKRIEPVFKKLLERSKANVQPSIKVCLEDNNNSVQSSCAAKFRTIERLLRASPVSFSARNTLNAISPIPSVKSSSLECPVQQHGLLNLRSNSSLRSGSSVKLVQPSIVFPSPEKLLSPIPAEAKNQGNRSAGSRKKLSPKNITVINKPKVITEQSGESDDSAAGRFCKRDEVRSGGQKGPRRSAYGHWNRHGMLPPISSKENMSASGAASKRSASALLKLGKPDLDTRPNTSLPSKSGVSLLPLDEFDTPLQQSRMELAQQWLAKQLKSPNYNKNHLTTHVDPYSAWRSRQCIHRK